MASPSTKLAIAGVLGLGLLALGVATDVTYVMLAAAVLSLGTPKRFMWIALVAWSFHFLAWACFEIYWLFQGDSKFGWMCIPYGVGALIFALAGWLSFRGVAMTFGGAKQSFQKKLPVFDSVEHPIHPS